MATVRSVMIRVGAHYRQVVRVNRQVERVNRVNRLLERLNWHLPRHHGGSGTRRVKLLCDRCGTVAAVVNAHPAGTRFADSDQRLIVRVGDRSYRHLLSVECPRSDCPVGPLEASWAQVLPWAAAARREGKTLNRRLRPRPTGPPG